MHIITQTPRLIIREFLPEELDAYLNHFNDEEVCRYIPKRTTAERINIFNAALEEYTQTKRLGKWGMFLKENGELIGSCLLRIYDSSPAQIEIGYSMDKKYWGQGIGTEMARALVEYAFTFDDVTEIVAVTTLENIGSQRVLEKAGLPRQDNVHRHGELLAYFSVTK